MSLVSANQETNSERRDCSSVTMSRLKEALAYINPIFFYYTIIFAVAKVYQIFSNSESIWQWAWNKVFDAFGDDPATYSIWILNGYSYLVFWIFGLILYVMDAVKHPKNLKEYKIQQESSSGIEKPGQLLKLIKVVLFNQLLSFVISYVLQKNIGNYLGLQVTRQLPSFPKGLLDLVVFMFSYEFLFYYSHRILHYKFLYKIHKMHHEYQTPIGISALYCHPIEHVVSNLIPIISGFPLMRCHVVSALLWLNLVMITTVNDHSGYHIPFLHSSELHDYHHLK